VPLGLSRWPSSGAVSSPVSAPHEYQLFPKCDLQAGGGAGSKQAVSDYVSQVLFQEAGSRRVPTARADASRLRTLRSMPLYWFFLGSGARVLGAAWGSADRRPGGATAPETATQAAAAARARPAPARCPVLGRCPSPGPNAGSMASSATWSPRGTKVPGQNPLGTAIQGPEWARRSLARAAALRRARAPRRREGQFVYRERKQTGSNRSSITRGAVGHSIPLVEGRRALRGAGAEPERLATRAWGMSGPVRIQEQNRTEHI